MLIFIILTILFILSGNYILAIFISMIQPEGALDVVFRWQKMLNHLYNGNKYQQLLGKAIGDCERCTSFWFMTIWFWAYYFFCVQVIDFWLTDNIRTIAIKIVINCTWYALFHSIGAMWGFALLKFKTRK